MMGSEEDEHILERVGAIITDTHVVYKSGRHGNAYVNKDALFAHPVETSAICRDIAFWCYEKGLPIRAVVGPVVGGAIMAQGVAFHFSQYTGRKILAVYADKEGDAFVIKRGYDKLIEGKATLVVEDVLTTGGSAKKVVLAARGVGANVVGLGAICNRGGVTAEDVGGVPHLFALANVQLEDWAEADCPLCAKGVPINVEVGHGREYLAGKKDL